jgi:hypothetical protein
MTYLPPAGIFTDLCVGYVAAAGRFFACDLDVGQRYRGFETSDARCFVRRSRGYRLAFEFCCRQFRDLPCVPIPAGRLRCAEVFVFVFAVARPDFFTCHGCQSGCGGGGAGRREGAVGVVLRPLPESASEERCLRGKVAR